ncbi:MAG TPA: hypothetical protein VM238_21135 [Phycisphaerae bacterium]|nr:hypothetical protein [Phycisphaerae bacterium]
MTVTITTDAWLAELERVQRRTPAGYLTVRQMAEQAGRSRDWIRRRLWELNREGRLATQPVLEADISGRMNRSTAYRILPKGK